MSNILKSILKKAGLYIGVLIVIFVAASIFLVLYTRHHLDFDPNNKDIDKMQIS